MSHRTLNRKISILNFAFDLVYAMEKTSRNSLFLDVRSADAVIFHGEARALSSRNNTGPFDILPRHENFISIIKDRLVIFPKTGVQKELKIDIGVLRVYKNKVDVFLGFETGFS